MNRFTIAALFHADIHMISLVVLVTLYIKVCLSLSHMIWPFILVTTTLLKRFQNIASTWFYEFVDVEFVSSCDDTEL